MDTNWKCPEIPAWEHNCKYPRAPHLMAMKSTRTFGFSYRLISSPSKELLYGFFIPGQLKPKYRGTWKLRSLEALEPSEVQITKIETVAPGFEPLNLGMLKHEDLETVEPCTLKPWNLAVRYETSNLKTWRLDPWLNFLELDSGSLVHNQSPTVTSHLFWGLKL